MDSAPAELPTNSLEPSIPPAQTQIRPENDDELDEIDSLAIQGKPPFDDDPSFHPQCHPGDPLLTDSRITPPELLETLSKSGNVHWGTRDVHLLLQYLDSVKTRAGDGGNFPNDVWTGAAIFLNARRISGPMKDAKKVKGKYSKALKHVYDLIKKIDNNSGWGPWDIVKGANIPPPPSGQADAWDRFSVQNKGAEKFRNKGWEYWGTMLAILGITVTPGKHVFRPGAVNKTHTPAIDVDTLGMQEDDPLGLDDIPVGASTDTSSHGRVLAPFPDLNSVTTPTQNKRPAIREPENAPTAKRPIFPHSTAAEHLQKLDTTPNPSSSSKLTGPKIMQGLLGRMDEFNGHMDRMVNSPMISGRPTAPLIQPSPTRRISAMSVVQSKESWLTRPQMMKLIVLLQNNTKLADAYLAMTDEYRMDWVALHLQIQPPVLNLDTENN
ncbi:hypothetical protein DL96DRAFT_1638871 [Flagelloscypha sp. PMI_526]|nr:hypothetical protein DL96DRAFT_1638871 [Flagelloscypha sp. PMI_526]